MASDLFSTLRVYLSKFSQGERNPSEVVSALNTWLRDSGESIKIKVEEEVERSVKKMGFVKQADFDQLSREVDSLKKTMEPSKKDAAKVNSRSRATAKKPLKSETVKSATKQTSVSKVANVTASSKSAPKKAAKKAPKKATPTKTKK